MEISKTAKAGTLESNDILIMAVPMRAVLKLS
jgi:citrate lyase gamma subunit